MPYSGKETLIIEGSGAFGFNKMNRLPERDPDLAIKIISIYSFHSYFHKSSEITKKGRIFKATNFSIFDAFDDHKLEEHFNLHYIAF